MRTITRAWGGYKFMCPLSWYLNRHLTIVLPERGRVESVRILDKKGKATLSIVFDIELTLSGRNGIRCFYFTDSVLPESEISEKKMHEVAAVESNGVMYRLYQLAPEAVDVITNDQFKATLRFYDGRAPQLRQSADLGSVVSMLSKMEPYDELHVVRKRVPTDDAATEETPDERG